MTEEVQRPPVLEMHDIVKRFGDYAALDGVGLTLEAGEVHALLGENGAGKTTLMNVASGVIDADAGSIVMAGNDVRIRSPRDAFRLGIGMVHQHFRLVPNFTVAENVHLGLDGMGRLANRGEMIRRAGEWSDRLDFAIDPSARVAALSVGELQRVAIMRALMRGARILILDEPTAVLTPQEASRLFVVLRAMAAEGRTVVFISHKLDEVMDVADRVTVLRSGRNVATLLKHQCSPASLARMMVGHEIDALEVRERRVGGEPVLVASGVSTSSDEGRGALRDVSLTVAEGEILGVAGVSGNGQRPLAEVLTGMRPPLAGTVRIGGRDLTGKTAREFTEAGVGHVPEDLGIGLSLAETIEMNAVMKAVDEAPIRRGRFLVRSAIRPHARELLGRAGLSALSVTRRVTTLSGGQAQRLVVHRELQAGKRVLVAVHPSRGLDVAAARTVQEVLLSARAQGAAIVLISDDLDEVFALSDRIVVLYEGQAVGEVDRSEYDRERIGLLMGGSRGVGGGTLADDGVAAQ